MPRRRVYGKRRYDTLDHVQIVDLLIGGHVGTDCHDGTCPVGAATCTHKCWVFSSHLDRREAWAGHVDELRAYCLPGQLPEAEEVYGRA